MSSSFEQAPQTGVADGPGANLGPNPGPDRRQFLQVSAGSLATAVRAATLPPALVTAALPTAALAQQAADEDPPLRVAVIGTGARGCDLIRALTTISTCRVIAVCDTYGPHRDRGWQAAGPWATVYSDYRSLLAKEKPAVVVIATPPATHAAMARAAIAVNAAVFCEKVLAMTVAEAVELAALVREQGTVFQVGLQRRANAIYRQAVAMVQAGMLGRITAIKCQWHRQGDFRRPVPVTADHPDFPALEQALNWKLYRASSLGLLAELGSHQLDIVNWMLGGPPERVLATGGIDYWRDGRDLADNLFCIYEYRLQPPPLKKGATPLPGVTQDPYTVRVTYSSLQNNAYEGASELILGTAGTLFLSEKKGLFFRESVASEIAWSNKAEDNAALVASGKTLKLSNDPWAHRGAPFEIDAEGDETRDQLVSFLEHVRNADPRTICPIEIGVENTAVVLMGQTALETQSPATYPLAGPLTPKGPS